VETELLQSDTVMV